MKKKISKVWATDVTRDGENTEYQLSAVPFYNESFMKQEWQKPHITWKLSWRVHDNWHKDVGSRSSILKEEYFSSNDEMIGRLEELAASEKLQVSVRKEGYHRHYDVVYAGGIPRVEYHKTWSNFD